MGQEVVVSACPEIDKNEMGMEPGVSVVLVLQPEFTGWTIKIHLARNRKQAQKHNLPELHASASFNGIIPHHDLVAGTKYSLKLCVGIDDVVAVLEYGTHRFEALLSSDLPGLLYVNQEEDRRIPKRYLGPIRGTKETSFFDFGIYAMLSRVVTVH